MVTALVAAAAWFQFGDAGGGKKAGTAFTVSIGGPFTLVDDNGKTVTDADFHGRFMMIFFGYTSCPDLCPTALSEISEALDSLGDIADRVVPVFVTIDPQRDTPENLKDYVGNFHPRLVGLTGTPQQIAAVAKAYGVFYVKLEGDGDQPADPEDYFMGHTGFTYLMGPDGKYLNTFSGGAPPQEMARDVKRHIYSQPRP